MRKSFTLPGVATIVALVLVLCAAAIPAQAATAGLTFTRPATYTDGTPLPAAEIASYNVRCSSFTPTGSTTPGSCPAVTPASLAGTATGGTLTLTLPAGGGSACFQLQTVSTSGATSDWTAPACKTFAPLVPNPPANVTVAVVIGLNMAPAYSVTATGRMSTLMGFVPLGRPCGELLFTYRGTEFREVARADVAWWGSTTLRVAAACGAAGA